MKTGKGKSRLLSLVLSLCLAVGLIAGAFPLTASADAPQVELYSARTKYYSTYEGSDFKVYFYFEGYVCIENSAATQAVTLHYSQAGGTWTDVAASYVCNDPDGYEVWYFQSTPVCGRVNAYPNRYSTWWDFCLKYEVNGNTYWDSNGGNNYYLSYNEMGVATPAVLKKSVVAKQDAYAGNTSFSGNVVLKNLAYTKNVFVRYTTDNWVTYTDASLSYSTSLPNDLESWGFNVTIPLGATVKFCFCYTVNGVSYWDNNFGRNYTL